MDCFHTFNPCTGEILKEHRHFDLPEAEKVTQAAYKSFQKWKKSDWDERSQFLSSVASALRKNSDQLSRLMTAEMGKPFKQAQAEVEKCAVTCEFYAKSGPEFLKPQIVDANYPRSEIHFNPLGVILAIMPWNFPLWQAIRFSAPAWMAGNVVLLKPSDLTAGTSELFVDIVKDLGSDILLYHLPMTHETSAEIIANPLVRGVTFTGSTRGGREVATLAAKYLKKTVLELGGSDPYIVLKDADIEKAAQICTEARLVNSGQSCVAAKRFIVEKPVWDDFLNLMVKKMKEAPMGDPFKETTKIGPMAAVRFQRGLFEQVEKLKRAGGKIHCGGQLPEGHGAFFPATVMSFEENNEDLRTEELFGPVALLIPARDENEALEIANSSVYGLGGAIFTKDIEKGRRLADDLESGFVVINDQVKSDARLPFGGVKDSGFGRELSSFGIHEFCNIKTLGISE